MCGHYWTNAALHGSTGANLPVARSCCVPVLERQLLCLSPEVFIASGVEAATSLHDLGVLKKTWNCFRPHASTSGCWQRGRRDGLQRPDVGDWANCGHLAAWQSAVPRSSAGPIDRRNPGRQNHQRRGHESPMAQIVAGPAVPMPTELVEALKEHRKTMMVNQHPGLADNWVFCTDKGRSRLPQSLNKAFSPRREAAKIEQRVSPQVLLRTITGCCCGPG